MALPFPRPGRPYPRNQRNLSRNPISNAVAQAAKSPAADAAVSEAITLAALSGVMLVVTNDGKLTAYGRS